MNTQYSNDKVRDYWLLHTLVKNRHEHSKFNTFSFESPELIKGCHSIFLPLFKTIIVKCNNALKSMLIGVHSMLNFLDRFFAEILFAHLKKLQLKVDGNEK